QCCPPGKAVKHPAEHPPGPSGAALHRRASPRQEEGAVMSRALSVAAQTQYFALQAAMAESYGVEDATRVFAVEPSLSQELNDKITEKSDFLQRINVVPVSELKGQKVMIGVSGPVTSRTNTKTTDRVAKDMVDLDALGYELFHTESDVGLPF